MQIDDECHENHHEFLKLKEEFENMGASYLGHVSIAKIGK